MQQIYPMTALQYLEELVEKELVVEREQSSEGRAYHLTEKGRAFLEEFVRIERFSEAFGIEV